MTPTLQDSLAAYVGVLRELGCASVELEPAVWSAIRQRSSHPVTERGKAAAPAVRESRPAPGRREAIPSAPAPAVSAAGQAFVDGFEAGGGTEGKKAALERVAEAVRHSARCRELFRRSKNMVFGVGTPDAAIMFVGEAPGADEDEAGEPFVGKAGQLLTKMIGAMGLERGDVYIANIGKFRPDMPPGSTGNRKPTAEEMEACLPFIRAQVKIIQPRVIVALGATAVEGLFGMPRAAITRLRGGWKEWEGIPVMPTYHPAYLLRNPSPAEKRKVWEDLLLVMEKTGMAITEKQRGYFLKVL